MQRYEKLYIVTRRDLSPGLQTAQVAHAAFQFAYEHRPLAQSWLQESNFLIILSTENEEELEALGHTAETKNLPVTWFREPDIEDELTAIAIAPSPATVEMTAHLPLALSSTVDLRDAYDFAANTARSCFNIQLEKLYDMFPKGFFPAE